MSNKNEVFEYLIDQLRQQVNNSQCEDLSHNVLSLKNQLHDASARIKELREDNIKKSGHISHLTGQVKELHLALATATGDVEAYKLIREQEQSGCRKDDTQECEHEWRCVVVFGNRLGTPYCRKCGVAKPEECEHDFIYHGSEMAYKCIKCGVIK